MADILTLDAIDAPGAADAVDALEAGRLVLLPTLAFALSAEEASLADPGILSGKSKNVSLSPDGARLSGHALEGGREATLRAMVARYAAFADDVVDRLLPDYAPAVRRRRTSFRPGAIDTRALSPRKDDKRLHVDAFPSTPVGGARILRVFSNVDPLRRERVWRVGGTGFGAFATTFRGRLRGRSALARHALQRIGVTRGFRTAYDQTMLELHDLAKLDDRWQAQAPRREIALPAGSTWVVYTDAVLHAAMSGCNALEQTYLMPVAAMRNPQASPLRLLEGLLERPLA